MKANSRILIVDDDSSFVWVAERVLHEEGFDVITAFDGQEGLKKAKEQKPDLIILDITMPRKDGYEVCRDLQEDPSTAHIPVVFLSAKGAGITGGGASIKDELTGYQSGALDFLPKPITREALLERVKALLWFGRLDAESKGKRSKPRILIIDDNSSFVSVCRHNLREEDFDVVTAFDGLEGFRKIREEKPDLILLDVVMPGLDGFEVLNFVRQHSKIPVIMLTTEHNVDSVKKALTLGADDYLCKPFNNQDLLARIRAKLARSEVEIS